MKYMFDNTSHNKAILSFRFLIYKTLSQSEFSFMCGWCCPQHLSLFPFL